MIRWKVEWVSQLGDHHTEYQTGLDDLAERVRCVMLAAKKMTITKELRR